MRYGKAGLLTTAGLAIATTLSTPVQAGLWEALFGRQVVAPLPAFDPLNVTVRARPKKAKVPAAPREEPAIAREWPMDIRNDPSWYLRDRTLARGDIIVLPNRVVVFEGGDTRPSNFRSYESTRTLSAKSRQTLKHLLSAPQETTVAWEPAPTSGRLAIETASGTVTGRR